MDFSLTDSRAVHAKCIDDIRRQIDEKGIASLEAQTGLGRSNIQLAEPRRNRRSIGRLISSLFAPSHQADEQKSSKNSLVEKPHSSVENLDRECLALKQKLVDIYDYWPDYPPDWEDRRRNLLRHRGETCEQCGAGKFGQLQAHHIKPFWKGGSNTAQNLQLLCIRCHGEEHDRDFEEQGFEKLHKKSTAREEIISSAIKGSQKITFMYKKFDESRGQRRTILPEKYVDVPSGRAQGFTRCVQGHCDLRGERRRFAVHRMYKIKYAED